MSKLAEQLSISKAKPETTAKSKRIPIGADRNVLFVEGGDPDKKYAWINESNVMQMKLSGYEHVPLGKVTVSDNTRYGSQYGDVISKGVGAGVVAYLMCIDRELYEQDMALHDRKIDEQEQGIFQEAKSGGLDGNLKFGRGSKNLA